MLPRFCIIGGAGSERDSLVASGVGAGLDKGDEGDP